MSLPKSKGNILFTGGRSPATLVLIRLFYNEGYKIFIAESSKNNVTGASKYVEKNFHMPPPAQEKEKYIDTLIEIIKDNNIITLIPACEEVYYISKEKAKLEQHCFVFTSEIDILARLHSKYQFVELLKEIGITAPDSILIDNKEDLTKELSKVEQFVLKPEYSRFASLVIINDKSPEKINKVQLSQDYPWLLQKFIKGKAYCTYSVAQNGKVLAHSIYPSVYCAGQGATVYFESVNIPEVDDIVFKIVKNLNYTGHIAFDIIHSEEDGHYYPIECNPRATSGINLFTEKDNLPLAFKKEIKLNNLIRSSGHVNSMVLLAMIIYCLPKNPIKDGAGFFKKIISARDVIFKLNDIKPFFTQFVSFGQLVSQSRRENISVLEATTTDIEWNGTWK